MLLKLQGQRISQLDGGNKVLVHQPGEIKWWYMVEKKLFWRSAAQAKEMLRSAAMCALWQ